jgi:hypothetical protein
MMKREPQDRIQTGSASKGRIAEVLDWIVKLLPIFATIAVAVVADQYKTSLTASTLLSEREKADSQLRSEMFSRLVDPISGAKSGADVSIEREQLLSELLALNFHEHIELKPLLVHVDNRLARASAQSDQPEQNKSARQSLRAVARQVIARQSAMLSKSNGDEASGDLTHIDHLDLGAPIAAAGILKQIKGDDDIHVNTFSQPIEVRSPSGHHKLWLIVDRPDWENETFHVDVSITAVQGGKEKEYAHHDFELSWFDFPLTDNTLLADGTRFAVVLDQLYDLNERLDKETVASLQSGPARRVKINIIWFPKDYIAARERPINYREFRRNLGLDNR